MTTNNHTQATVSFTKAASRLFLSISICKQLYTAPYLAVCTRLLLPEEPVQPSIDDIVRTWMWNGMHLRIVYGNFLKQSLQRQTVAERPKLSCARDTLSVLGHTAAEIAVCILFHRVTKCILYLSVVKAWVRLFCMYLYSINTSMWFIHTSVFPQWLVNIMKLKDFSLSPTHLIRLYLSRDEDGWDCHHQQKQTQRLIGGNYAG